MAIFSFNIGGYYLLLSFIQSREEAKLESRLDSEDIDEQDAMVVKVPLTLPYPIYQEGYERVSGTFEWQGELLHLVKQKIVKDTLYIVCVKNSGYRHYDQALKDYTLKMHEQKGKEKTLQTLSKLMEIEIRFYSVTLANAFCVIQSIYPTFHSGLGVFPDLSNPSPPPEGIS